MADSPKPAARVGPSLAELLGETLIVNNPDKNNAVTEVPVSSLSDCEAVAIYFSAHWCPPCRGFTPRLIQTYKDINQDGRRLEVVFCSWDTSDKEFGEYFNTMPWAAIPFGPQTKGLKEKLAKRYQVQGIPALVMLKKDGSTITTHGRDAVLDDPKGTRFPWDKEPAPPPPTFLDNFIRALPTRLLQAYLIYIVYKLVRQNFPQFFPW